jgi:hypothetical protein
MAQLAHSDKLPMLKAGRRDLASADAQPGRPARALEVEPTVLTGADLGWENVATATAVADVLIRHLGYKLKDVGQWLGRDIAEHGRGRDQMTFMFVNHHST